MKSIDRPLVSMKKLANLIYEAGVLSRVRRSGWWLAGIPDPESVAEHSFRTAVIAFILATLEDLDPERAVAMALFHDLHETRVLDMNKVGQRYADWEKVESKVIAEQLVGLPAKVGNRIRAYKDGFQQAADALSVVVRDADHLECLVRAREYQAEGRGRVDDWITNSRRRLRTKSAKSLARELIRTDPQKWWEGLKQRIMKEQRP